MPVLVRDALELLIVVALGGMLVSAVRRIRRGQIAPLACPHCGRPTSRAYDRCRWCSCPLP